MDKDKEVIKCPSCGKGFPVNYWKHPNRETIQCPFCRTKLKQGLVDREWKPNEEWTKRRKIDVPFTVAEMRRQMQNALRRLRGN